MSSAITREQLLSSAEQLLEMAVALNDTSDIQLEAKVVGALAALCPRDVWVGEILSAARAVSSEVSA